MQLSFTEVQGLGTGTAPNLCRDKITEKLRFLRNFLADLALGCSFMLIVTVTLFPELI